MLDIPTDIDGASLIISSGIRILPFLGVLEGSCWGGSASNLSTANDTLFNETVDKSFTERAGEGNAEGEGEIGVGGLLTVGDATFGEESSFTRGIVLMLLPLLDGSFLDELSTGAAVLTAGNAFLTAETVEGADLLPNRDPKIDRLDFSLPDELLLLILAFDKEEIGRGSFPLAGEGVPVALMFEFDSLGLDETTALDMEVERFFFTRGTLALLSSPFITSSASPSSAAAKLVRPLLLTGVRSGKFSVPDPNPLPSPSVKFDFSLFERAAFDMDEDLARGLLLLLLLLSTTFGAEADEDGLDGFVFTFRLLLPLYSQSTGTSNSVFVIMTWLVSPLLALPCCRTYVSAFFL